MKKIYELPEVTVFEVGPVNNMLVETSNGLTVSDDVIVGGDLSKDNYFDDDQSTPWYRR